MTFFHDGALVTSSCSGLLFQEKVSLGIEELQYPQPSHCYFFDLTKYKQNKTPKDCYLPATSKIRYPEV